MDGNATRVGTVAPGRRAKNAAGALQRHMHSFSDSYVDGRYLAAVLTAVMVEIKSQESPIHLLRNESGAVHVWGYVLCWCVRMTSAQIHGCPFVTLQIAGQPSISRWLSYYGYMIWVMTDRGPNSTCSLMKNLTDCAHVRHHFNTAYSTWADRAIERLEGSVKK